MIVRGMDSFYIKDIDDVKKEFPKEYKTWLEEFITKEEMWDDEFEVTLRGKDVLTTIEALWKKGSKECMEEIGTHVDNFLDDFLDFITVKLDAENNGLSWSSCLSDDDNGGYELWADEVILQSQDEAVHLIAQLIKSGVKVNFKQLHAQVLKEVIK